MHGLTEKQADYLTNHVGEFMDRFVIVGFDLEDEMHALIRCPKGKGVRLEMIQQINSLTEEYLLQDWLDE